MDERQQDVDPEICQSPVQLVYRRPGWAAPAILFTCAHGSCVGQPVALKGTWAVFRWEMVDPLRRQYMGHNQATCHANSGESPSTAMVIAGIFGDVAGIHLIHETTESSDARLVYGKIHEKIQGLGLMT